MPSRFIDELPADHVDVLTPPGLYGGGYGAASAHGGGQGSGQSNLESAVANADVYNSPGWRRLQSRANQRGTAQPGGARKPVIDLTAVSSHTVGDRVFHQKFGYGTISEVDGDKLGIEFEKAGPKKVVAHYVSGADDIQF
jgi:DNA helicase-2/ATP-dependent DNA helicase PcrA